MHDLEIALVALGLAMDAFAVSVAIGASGQPVGSRALFRLSFHFGLFQALMPVMGWLAGRSVAVFVATVDHWVAAALLGGIGIKMIWEACLGSPERSEGLRPVRDRTRGWTLVGLSLGVSIDALALGFGLSMLEAPILRLAAVVGLVTAALSLGGLHFGRRLGRRFGSLMEGLGGVVLVGLGVRILLSHLLVA